MLPLVTLQLHDAVSQKLVQISCHSEAVAFVIFKFILVIVPKLPSLSYVWMFYTFDVFKITYTMA